MIRRWGDASARPPGGSRGSRVSSFLPFTSETGEIYSALDIVTFPNQGVGLGRPVLEAATFGKPVVASGSDSGAGVLLPGDTGLLLDDPQPQEIAKALRRLIRDPDLRRRLGSAAADHARAQFDPKPAEPAQWPRALKTAAS